MSLFRASDEIKGLGIMSGSSLDGLDIALCSFKKHTDGWKGEILSGETFHYESDWSDRLRALSSASAYDFAKTTVDFAHLIGFKIRSFSIAHGKDFQYVASHGHTVFHRPERHFTAQIGCGETLSTYLSVPLITNFRNKDVALGGQGAPLVPVGEKNLFPETSLFLNLGGIANLSILSRETDNFQLMTIRRGSQSYIGFDVCACNIVLNHLAAQAGKPFDDGGKIAQSGSLLPEWKKYLDELSFYYLFPPRTLGREWVETEILSSLPTGSSVPDLLHTYCLHVAEQIAAQFAKFNIRNTRMMITGGGAFNTFLVQKIKESLAEFQIDLHLPDEKLIKYKEALIFAFLGLNTLSGEETTLASVTGARHNVVSGSIHLPAYDTRSRYALRAFLEGQPFLSSN